MNTGTYLDRILPRTLGDLEGRKRKLPRSELLAMLRDAPPPLDIVGALREPRTFDGIPQNLHLMAEIKRASPSRGRLVEELDVRSLARKYVEGGASALSVLTDVPFFQGSLGDLAAVREVTAPANVPLLRKDFMLDPYQIEEARLWGADAVLLIVACLEDTLLVQLSQLAESMGMGALIEVHDEEELERASLIDAKLIGINNRDLRSFETKLTVTEGLAPRVSMRTAVVAESGIATRADAERMRLAGADAILVGEALITTSDTVAKVRELLGP